MNEILLKKCVISSENEQSALDYLMERERKIGIDHKHRVYWRRRDAITYGRGWVWQNVADNEVKGLSTFVDYEENDPEVQKGIFHFDLADLDELPPNHGIHCLAQPAVILEAALTAAMIAPPRLMITCCSKNHSALAALLGLGAIRPTEDSPVLCLTPDAIVSAARELAKHLGVGATTTTGKLGRAKVELADSGILFGVGHHATISRIAKGDLSAIGYNTIHLQQPSEPRSGICAA